ncbi:MAG TPA: 50S ribosomal protein L21 [Candidatus Paceibacterota bacterium]
MTFAIIKTGGKQYKVAEGDVLRVEKLNPSTGGDGQEVVFDKVLLVVNGEVKVGKPVVSGAKVSAKVLEEGKGDKKMVFRYKSKTRQHKKKGHRQPYTKIQITKITLS